MPMCFDEKVSKIKGFPPSIDEDFTVMMAGTAQVIACALLVAYREPPEEVHKGVNKWCNGAWPLTIGAYCLAFVSQGIILTHIGWNRYPSLFNRVCGSGLEGVIGCLDSCCAIGGRFVQSFCTIFGHRGRSDSGSINDGSSPSHAHRRRRRRRRRGGGEGGGGGGRGDNIEADYEMCDMKSGSLPYPSPPPLTLTKTPKNGSAKFLSFKISTPLQRCLEYYLLKEIKEKMKRAKACMWYVVDGLEA